MTLSDKRTRRQQARLRRAINARVRRNGYARAGEANAYDARAWLWSFDCCPKHRARLFSAVGLDR